MNLFSKIGLPDLVTLNTALTDFLGPLAPIVVTMLNGMAFLIIMLLVARLSVIAIRAITEFNKDAGDTGMVGGSHSGILQAAIRSGVEAFFIALVGYLVIAFGPNLLFFIATEVTNGILAKPTDYLPAFAGPFAGLVASAQNAVSLGVIILGVFLASKIWWGALAGSKFAAKSGESGGSMGALNDAAKRTAILAVLVIIAFATVLKGPQLFFEIINGAKSSVPGL